MSDLSFVLILWAVALCAAETEPVFQYIKVKQGDTLWGIANTYLKNPRQWDQILKHNRLPSSDPTVALPGMPLKIPVNLIKENLRAAHLVYQLNRVNFRRQETAEWKPTSLDMELFRGDTLRTYEASKARVKFLNADLLSLDANSMAIIKPINENYDVFLTRGALFVGRSRVVTATAQITPKTRDTQYSAKVRNDFSTLVEVYTGLAAVAAQGKSVDVQAGMSSEVRSGLAPSPPRKIADLSDFEARAAEFTGSQVEGQARMKIAKGAALPMGADVDSVNKATDADNLTADVASLSVGLPISAYRVQASRSRDFEKIIFDKVYDSEEKVNLREVLSPGVYWWRVSLIDLLGTEDKPSAPRLYSVGLAAAAARTVDLKSAIALSKPSGDEAVSSDRYRVVGRILRDNLTITVNGRSARQDENGNFFSEVRLQSGANDIAVTVSDESGNSTTISRRLTYH